MAAHPGEYGGGTYGSGLYGGGTPRMPTQHFRVVLDADPMVLGGIITGDNSTLESLGDWEAGPDTDLTLNTATSRVYAGHACARLEATDDADISITLPEQGTVTAHRTYLLWVHVRGEDTARDVSLTVQWRSATGVALTTETVTRAEVTTGYVRVGMLATAPPAAAELDVTVTVADCELGEIHYVDTVTCDYAGTDLSHWFLSGSCSLSGRDRELERTDSGSLTMRLSNRYGWLTPGATTDIDGDPIPAPYLGNLDTRRRVFVLAEYAGILHPIWSGYTRRWVATYPGGSAASAEVVVDADDAFRWLTTADVPPAYRAEVRSDGPLSLYPLDEPGASAAAGDLVFGAPAQLLSAGAGAGDSGFGADTVLPITLSGSNTDGGSSSLGLNLLQEDLADQGAVLDLRFAGGMPPQVGTVADWTLEFWFAFGGPVAPPATPQVLFRHIVPSGGVDFLSGFQVLLLDTGAVRVTTGGSETVATSGVGLADGVGHHVVLTYEDDGSAHGLATLYVDAAEAGSLQLTATPLVAGMPQVAQLGGALSTLTNSASFMAQCRFQHVAFYYRRLSASRIVAHWGAGFLGYHTETDGDRLAAVLRFAGWPDEDTRVDAGLTPLAPRNWGATNATALTQDVTAYGGGAQVIDARGAFRQLNRHRFVNEVLVAATFRDADGTDAEPDDFSPWIDDTGLANIVEVNRVGGGTIQVQSGDATTGSIRRYGRIKGEPIPFGAASDAESLTHARWQLTRTDTARVRVATSTFRPDSAGGAMWPLILPREYGDRINLADLPATAPADPLDVLIGRVAHEWPSANEWVTHFAFEPALIDQMGVCDHPVYGIADDPLCIAGY